MIRKEIMDFRKKIESAAVFMPDENALDAIELFPKWKENVGYLADFRVRYNDTLYKCLTSHTSQATWNPLDAPSLWAKVLIPDSNVIYDWEQPNSTNPYNKGDKVKYDGKIWESAISGNVWRPGEYGWEIIG